MRIELEETKEKIQEINHEDLRYKHESDLTPREKRLLERQKLSQMGFSDKLKYIWAYYKALIFGVLGAVVLVFAALDAYDHAKIKTILSITAVNSTGVFSPSAQEEIESLFGAQEDKYRTVEIAANVNTNGEGTELDPYAQMAFVTKTQAGTIDALVMPQSFCQVLEEEGYFADLTRLLDEETLESFGEEVSQTCVILRDSPLKEALGLPYEPVCVGVLANAPNPENAAAWIASLRP
ncbi:MAG: hypothetical protein Q4D55_01575 [Eubacteriales bacterium]|nr:hypothetical protein [Eubacteriales bacterium]